jgi:ABC-2 type transport system permease protein
MIKDILIIMWKEWKEIIIQRGSTRGGIISLIVIVLILGVLPPIQWGPAWVESPFALVLALWIPLMLVSNVVSDSFAGERERHTLETLLASRLSDRAILFGKLATAISYGWGIALATVLLGLISINLVHGGNGILVYEPRMGLGIILSSMLSAGLSAGVGVLVSLRASSVRQAQQTLGLAIMLVIFVPIFGLQALPTDIQMEIANILLELDSWRVLSIILIILVGVDTTLIGVAMARFQRNKLILD